MNAARPTLIAVVLAGLAACAAPPPPPPPPSDEQPIKAAPSTPVERQAEPALDSQGGPNGKDRKPETH